MIFPRVESIELFERAVSWTKFPPVGVRGFGLNAFHIDHEQATLPQMIEHINAETMVVLQIETVTAFEMRDELLAVPGIDAVMIGPAACRSRWGSPASSRTPSSSPPW